MAQAVVARRLAWPSKTRAAPGVAAVSPGTGSFTNLLEMSTESGNKIVYRAGNEIACLLHIALENRKGQDEGSLIFQILFPPPAKIH